MSRAGRRWIALLVATLVACGAVGVLTLRGEEDPTPRLAALQADPMASYAPAGAELVSSRATEERAGSASEKPRVAVVLRTFRLRAGDAPSSIRLAARAAEAAGWTMDDPMDGEGASGRRRLSTGEARVTLAVVTDPALLPDGLQAPSFTVRIQHLG